MIAAEIIRNKREGKALSSEEIQFIVDGASQKTIPDYQLSAWLMTVFFKGMNPEETLALTSAMKKSGKTFHWKEVNPKLKNFSLIDKHSTGGVGDKVSLILVPLAIELGLKVPMMSGRGLGHTGGTVDKLLTIPGFRMDIAEDKAAKLMEDVGACMLSQTEDVCPADKKLYHLRDVTATVESFPLITASIVSKKWAEGCEGIIFDVKYGEGAFMATPEKAEELATWLLKVSQLADLRAEACLSRMEEPLGSCIGNSLEVEESIWILKNSYPSPKHKEIAAPLATLTCQIAARMAMLGGTRSDYESTVEECQKLLESGKTFSHFDKLVRTQGAINTWQEELPKAKNIYEIQAPQSGVISKIFSRELGLLGVALGMGRKKMEDNIDASAGFELLKNLGDSVQKNEVLAKIHLNTPLTEENKKLFLDCFVFSDKAQKPSELLWKFIQQKQN